MKGLAAIVVLALIWTAGLLAFADRIARLTPPDEPAAADGIVALTGGSDLRLEAATDLLEGGKGHRLLVSGVNRQATRGDAVERHRGGQAAVRLLRRPRLHRRGHLGQRPRKRPVGQGHGLPKLILVTADYHMPRALIELRSAMPGAQVTPYPVATPALNARHWWTSSLGARRMILEYCKYLAILAREAVFRLAGEHRVRRQRTRLIVFVRSLIFVALFYLWSILTVLGALPLLLAPRAVDGRRCQVLGPGDIVLVRVVCGVRVEFRGLEHLPTARP